MRKIVDIYLDILYVIKLIIKNYMRKLNKNIIF